MKLFALLTAWLGFSFGAPLQAANLLVNGDFESVTMTNGNAQHSTIFGTFQTNLPTLTGWTTSGYNFVMMNNPTYLQNNGGPKTLTGADDFFDGAYTTANPANTRLLLWGPDGYGTASTANGLTNSPTGGNFLAADGAYWNRPISQVVNNLEVGKTYQLTFWWAAAQQYSFNGATTEGWKVCFGTCTYTFPANVADAYSTFDNIPSSQLVSTANRSNPNHGFQPWQFEYYTFTATSSSMTLSLLAYGTPLGQPPFSLIDGVSLQAVPEPTTWAMMLIGFGLVGSAMRTRKRSFDGKHALARQII
jgi:hypothetical protein